MPSIYKASSVIVDDNAVKIDVGHAHETERINTVTPGGNTGNEPHKADEYGKSKEDLLGGAFSEAEIILQNARNEARLITENTIRETDRLRAEALESARSQGYNEGFNKGVADWDAIKREAEQILFEAYAEREEIIKNMEPQMVHLINKILSKLLGDYARLNPEIILKLIHEGFSVVVGSDGVKLRVSPEDYGLVREHFDKVTEYAGSNSVELVKDASLKPMDCVIETSYGNIDSSLDQQFEALKADLLYTLSCAEG